MIHPRDYKNGHVMKFDSRICIFITKKIPYVGRDGKRRFEKSENDDVIT